MKTGFLLFGMILSFSLSFAQYDYFKPVYTTAEMNVKGDVRKIVEKSNEVDKKGKPVDGFISSMTYLFDKNKRLRTTYDLTGESGLGTLITERFMLKDGKLVFVKHLEEEVYVSFTSGNQSRTILKDETDAYFYSGNEIQVQDSIWKNLKISYTMQDNRIIAAKHYGENNTEEEKETFEYNVQGQLIKATSISKDEKTNQVINIYTLIEYNAEGDVKKVKVYSNDKLAREDEYDYTYGDRNNWTECNITSKELIGKREKSYEKITRTYEYY